ncbi:filamentous hemagglutinin N-terminal domain-containing protein [Aerosakkonema sp. BLCC-F183]|uniref:two-partner secretion domain-containing protein n=1 Tax=Aerosakkonema sp. BLCC-F183 TaxID=3342834 RepID=UPI0035B8C2EF
MNKCAFKYITIKPPHFPLCLTFILAIANLVASVPGRSQIVPDATVNSIVVPNGNTVQIDGGTTVGGNLFHSFQEFSLPTGTEAFFNNALSIENIITRVTGNKISNIDGLIRANGTANLFLLNPNGIVFGQNAQLNIGGSFIGSTAESLLFENGNIFSANNPQVSPLLTINVPVGLQFSSNPGTIVVQGRGHNAQLFLFPPSITNLNRDAYRLQVKPGKTLALVGGNVTLEGGILSTLGGRIELGSVTDGSAILNALPQGLTLTYPATNTFGNIQMTQRALADASGINTGGVQIQGQQVNIESGSLVFVQNQGNQTAADIKVSATESLHINGLFSSIFYETLATGATGNIILTAPSIAFENGGSAISNAFSDSPGANIIVNASKELNVTAQPGERPFTPLSTILTINYGNGVGGNISVTTQHLSLVNSGQVQTTVVGSGNGGNITVKADSILVVGSTPPPGTVYGQIVFPSVLTVSTFGLGNSGNLAIETRTLSVQNGGIVSASTLGQGNAGNVRIDASESIEVKDRVSQEDASQIAAAADTFGISLSDLRGNGGQVTINTPVLKVSNAATVFVENQGAGDAGILRINADKLQLENGSNISASTIVGEGGNIDLQISTLLQMRDRSFISAEAGGRGNGGNITLNAPVLVGLENSDIIANAVQGAGGNIQIGTQGIFGLAFRTQLTPESDITASSQLGVNGTVNISTFDFSNQNIVFVPPHNFLGEAPVIASSCLTRRNTQQGRFVVTGNGGISETPDTLLMPYEAAQVRNMGQLRESENRSSETSNSTQRGRSIQEATGWDFTPDGKLVLVVKPDKIASPTELTCSN